MKTRRFLFVVVSVLLGASRSASAQFTTNQFTTIDAPLGVGGTIASGVYGTDIVGYYTDSSSNTHGFKNVGSSFTTLDNPDGTSTTAYGISGTNIVGGYQTTNGAAGFLYDGASYTKLLYPGSPTKAAGIEGNTIVGAYVSQFSQHGFIYKSGFYTNFDVPNGSFTTPTGISNGRIVGSYSDTNDFSHGFLYNGNGNTFTTLDAPLASAADGGTQANGISGGNIVGAYFDSHAKPHGFIYNGSSYTTFDNPLGVQGTVLNGIDGVNVVGYYLDAQGKNHGFLAVPASQSFGGWESRFGISTQTAGGTILYGDGTPLLMKYFANIDPSRPMTSTDRAALPAIIAATTQGTSTVTLRYRRCSTAAQATPQVQTSVDMADWINDSSDVPVTTGSDAFTGDPIVQVQIQLVGGARFVRLQVTGP